LQARAFTAYCLFNRPIFQSSLQVKHGPQRSRALGIAGVKIFFYKSDVPSVTKLTASKHWRKKATAAVSQWWMLTAH